MENINDKDFVLNSLKSEDPDVRREGVEDVLYSGFKELAPDLVRLLTDPDKGVRDVVAEALKQFGNEKIALQISDYLENEDIEIRNYASDILISIGSDSVKAVITKLLDSDSDVRKFAVDILGLIGSEKNVDDIVKMIDDEDPNVSISAVEALGNLKSVKAESTLIEVIRKQEDTAFKSTAVEALGKINSRNSRAFLYTLIDSEDPVLVLTALETLGITGSEGDLKTLSLLISKKAGFLLPQIITSMMNIAKRVEIDLLPLLKLDKNLELIAEECFEDLDFMVKFGELIGKNLDDNLLELIIPYLNKMNSDLKKDIISFVRMHDSKNNDAVLTVLISDNDSWVRYKTIEAIGEKKYKNLIEFVRQRVEDSEIFVIIAAVRVLSIIGDENDIIVLEKLKKKDDRDLDKEIKNSIDTLTKRK